MKCRNPMKLKRKKRDENFTPSKTAQFFHIPPFLRTGCDVMGFEIDTGYRVSAVTPEPYEKVGYSFQNDWCKHLQNMLTRSLTEAGVPLYKERCICCLKPALYARTGLGYKRAKATWGDIRVDLAFDLDELEKMDPQERLVTFRDGLFQLRYREHLSSQKWQSLRLQVLDREQGQCERCSSPAQHVHHKTYQNLGNEALHDLEALCAPCHFQEHGRVF